MCMLDQVIWPQPTMPASTVYLSPLQLSTLGNTNTEFNESYAGMLFYYRSHLKVFSGQCCCSSQCSSSGCWDSPQHCGSRMAVQGAQDCPVWCRYEQVALGQQSQKWRPCRRHQSYTGSHSSHTGQWCSYTKELQKQTGAIRSVVTRQERT